MKQDGTMEAPSHNDSAGIRAKKFWQFVAALIVVAVPITATLVLIYVAPWLFADP